MPVDPLDSFVPTRERIDVAFQSHAMTYLALGWAPIPVKGKSVVPKGVTGAQGVVNREKVEKQLITRELGYDNLGLRHEMTVAIDPDVYNGKQGNLSLERFRAEHSLPHLPPTYSSTARGDDSPSRQYFFRLREYVKLESKPRLNGRPTDDVEICQLHHRFSVVYPSVHPDTGTVYRWYLPGLGGLSWGASTTEIPNIEDLPYLPDEWVEALRKGEDSELDLDADVTDAQSLVSQFRDGEPSTPVRTALEEARTQHPGHDETYRSLFKALRYGREGHPGVKELVGVIVARHRHYLETEHPDRAAKGEVEAIILDTATKAQQMPVDPSSMYRLYSPLVPLNGTSIAVGPGVTGGSVDTGGGLKPLKPVSTSPGRAQSTTRDGTDWDAALAAGVFDEDAFAESGASSHVLPRWVWEQSVELATIKKAALSRMVSPDAVLHAALATIASLIHHESYLETGRGPTVLSYYAAAIGPSGAGKTEALSCADDLMQTWREGQIVQLGRDGYRRAELGSGEGMVEAYMGDDREFVPQLDEHNEPLIDDDTGEPIGKWTKTRRQVRHNAMFFSDEGRQMLAIASRSGSTVMSTLCSMWSGTSTGAANAKVENSRTVAKRTYTLGLLVGFQPATMDALFDDVAGGAPQRFAYASAIHPDVTIDEVDWPEEISPRLPAYAPIRMELSPKHRLIVRRHQVQKNNGEIELGRFDGHRMLLHARTAALLALLHSQTHISDEMWDLAEVIVDVSCDFRDDLASRAQREAEEAARKRAEAQVKTNVTSAVMVEETSKLAAVVDAIVDKLGDAPNGELPKRELRSLLSGSMRVADVFNPAVERAVIQGRIITDDVLNPDTGRKIAVLRLVDSED